MSHLSTEDALGETQHSLAVDNLVKGSVIARELGSKRARPVAGIDARLGRRRWIELARGRESPVNLVACRLHRLSIQEAAQEEVTVSEKSLVELVSGRCRCSGRQAAQVDGSPWSARRS